VCLKTWMSEAALKRLSSALMAGSRVSGVKEGADALRAGEGGGGDCCGRELADDEVADAGRIARGGCRNPDMIDWTWCFGW
jgi:hypothetical protein